ncbi:MAG: adenylate/guanylate cyclase domain-containing protein [Rhodospirillaceae bacterium]|jgi:adenylate cyclase|uniref:CHASE2 domain-containing protein n=1 Tax=Hwanghaeella sp. 1Z406 TaxID=3402811 RepID=UPI000C56CBD5|nr:adenylate/guanylate cyclase domain-containing protein [Rhodospirillales bacterium]MAX48523.1 adenylate/guanylate cyclase domain-containing protein [Rhodospirillaceae bacterium]|tara:strand:- start:21374 stop:23665 length:2292 start_codon:yes stop_codon:yes gene_type:complete
MSTMTWFGKKAHFWAPLLLLIGALFVRASEPNWLEGLQFAVFDELMRAYPRDYNPDADIPVRIVDIDEDSLAAHGQWPWSRLTIAQMVLNLRQAGAAVVAFDIVFSEPDRISPPNAVKEWSVLEGAEDLMERIKNLPDFDAAFAQYLEALNPVVLGFVLSQDERLPRIPDFDGTFATKGLNAGDVRRFLKPVYTGAVTNLPIFEKAASGNGSFSMRLEQDGLVRRVPVIFQLDPKNGSDTLLYPSLVAEAFRTVQGVKTMIVRAAGTDSTASLLEQGNVNGLANIQIGAKTIPTDPFGRIWLHSTGHRQERFISAKSVLDGTFDPTLVQGAIVFVGATAAGLLDLRATALASQYPGVEIHAEIAEQVISDHFLERPGTAFYFELGFILILGLLLIIAMPRLGAAKSALFGGICVMGAFGFAWMMFTQHLQLFDPVFPSGATLAIYLAGTVILFVREESQRRQIRGAFAHYLSPDLVQQLAEQPERLKLGGETKTLTFLFCDVRGFTTISESFKGNPQGLTLLINRFLTPLTDCILDRRGTIDKYMGDCIMAFWNAPLDVPNHPKDACESALSMFEALEALNKEREAEAQAAGDPFLPLNIGIGVNTGDCVVGNMGSDQRFDYSVLGDAVNLASRLEGQSKSYGVGIVLGTDTWHAVADDFATLELDRIAVKGKSEAVTIATCIGRSDLRQSQEFLDHARHHETLLSAFRAQEWDQAESLLKALTGKLSGQMDGFYAIYQERIDEYRQNPPPANWDGVYIATSK